jgi:hypothetical protein
MHFMQGMHGASIEWAHAGVGAHEARFLMACVYTRVYVCQRVTYRGLSFGAAQSRALCFALSSVIGGLPQSDYCMPPLRGLEAELLDEGRKEEETLRSCRCHGRETATQQGTVTQQGGSAGAAPSRPCFRRHLQNRGGFVFEGLLEGFEAFALWEGEVIWAGCRAGGSEQVVEHVPAVASGDDVGRVLGAVWIRSQ